MDLISLGLLAIAIILMYMYFRFHRRLRELPPCPVRPWPIIGNLLSLSSDQKTQFRQWRHQCGDIFSIHLGPRLLVVVSGYDLIKETFVKRADEFSDRPSLFLDEIMNYQGKGIATNSGPVWKEQRGVALSILRLFGFGKNVLAERVQGEVEHYLDHLSSYGGQPMDIKKITTDSTANIICSILTGQRFQYTDPIFLELMSEIENLFAANKQLALCISIPVLRVMPFFNINGMKQNLTTLYRIFQHFIDTSRDKDAEDNFIATYVAEKESRNQNGEATTMDEDNLLKIVFELFLGGTETTSTTISWFVLYMLHYPDVQKKVFAEIKAQIGINRAPSIEDKEKMVYMNATIKETQRFASILPQSVLRSNRKDLTIRNYTIPKDSFIVPNLDSVLFDEKIWGSDVQSYRPERFLVEGGQLKNPEEFIPFGVGRRVCLGESMAKTELFLYLSSMIQRFEILPVDPDQLPPLRYISGLTIIPESYLVQLVERKK